MATPLAAGLAALVRQYYTDGFYPTGEAVNANKIASPSAALIKATIINSAAHLTGNVHLGQKKDNKQYWPLTNLPDAGMFDGFGRPDVSKVLMRKGAPWQLKVWDIPGSAGFTGAGATKVYTINEIDLSVLFKTTVVWGDAPARAGGSGNALVNDLDLTVTVKASTSSAYPVGKVLYGNGGNSADHKNNVERVMMQGTGTVSVDITVTAYAVPVSTPHGQGFALVATGQWGPPPPIPTSCDAVSPYPSFPVGVSATLSLTGTKFGQCNAQVAVTTGSTTNQYTPTGTGTAKEFTFTPSAPGVINIQFQGCANTTGSVAACPPVFASAISAQATVTVTTDMPTAAADVASLKTKIRSALAGALFCNVNQIYNLQLAAGSVVASFNFLQAGEGTATPDAMMTDYAAAAGDARLSTQFRNQNLVVSAASGNNVTYPVKQPTPEENIVSAASPAVSLVLPALAALLAAMACLL